MRTTVRRGLGDALEKAYGGELGEVITGSAGHREEGPDEGHEGEPDAGSDLLDDETVRDLSDDV